MAKKLAKVNVTSDFRNWWEMDLSRLFNPDKVQIISAVVDEGALYLIYTYDDVNIETTLKPITNEY